MNRLSLNTCGEKFEVWDDLPVPYTGDPGNFDKYCVVVQAGYNGSDEPVMTVFAQGWPVMTIDVHEWEWQERQTSMKAPLTGEVPYALCTPEVESTGAHAQSLASFMLHIGMVGDPEGDNAFGTAVAEIGIWKAQETSPYDELLDDGHEVLAFVERMVEVYRQYNPEV